MKESFCQCSENLINLVIMLRLEVIILKVILGHLLAPSIIRWISMYTLKGRHLPTTAFLLLLCSHHRFWDSMYLLIREEEKRPWKCGLKEKFPSFCQYAIASIKKKKNLTALLCTQVSKYLITKFYFRLLFQFPLAPSKF